MSVSAGLDCDAVGDHEVGESGSRGDVDNRGGRECRDGIRNGHW